MGVASTINLADVLKQAPRNITIVDSLTKAHSVLSKHEEVMCSVSGGSDSDLLVDICCKFDPCKRIKYVWFNTGVEFTATKDHLNYLEYHYGIEIERKRPIKGIPQSCKEYGQPFISKLVSEFIYRLQSNGFDFKNGDMDYKCLIAEYPKCKSALSWWCNENGEGSVFGISRNRYLKEFMIDNPPWFRISNKCCEYAKKKSAHETMKAGRYDLNITGIRKGEGILRSAAYKNCYTVNAETDYYRPIFWYSDADKKAYCDWYGVRHSDCYEKYGMKRTGCVGCPYSQNLDFELDVLKEHEPNLHKAACHIFKDSYEYTRMYHEYRRRKKSKGQMEIWDFIKERNNTLS